MDNKQTMAAPDVTGSILGKIDFLEGAIVVPPEKGLQNQSVQRSGVLAADGTHCLNGITWRGESQVTIEPKMPPADTIGELKGTYMFLGPLFGHFGHFLVESICRIWAFEQLKDKIDGVLYVPKFQNAPERVATIYRPFLNALGVDAPMHNLADPTRVERLYVPQQGFGMFQMIEGAPEFRDFIRKHAGKSIAPDGPEKLYISRSALPAVRGSILFESRLEKALVADGYHVFHPQKHSFQEQVAAYRAARKIISVDCSPLHLLALVGDSEQRVGIIARRGGGLDEYFARQIRAFQGAKAFTFDSLRGNWVEKGANRPSKSSWGQVDFVALGQGLVEAGLLEDDSAWPQFAPDDLAAEVARISKAAGTEFGLFEAR